MRFALRDVDHRAAALRAATAALVVLEIVDRVARLEVELVFVTQLFTFPDVAQGVDPDVIAFDPRDAVRVAAVVDEAGNVAAFRRVDTPTGVEDEQKRVKV